MKTYDWRPTECADKNYPMKIVAGDFIFADGSSIYIPAGRLLVNGWGERGSTHIAGDDLKPIPVAVRISWFSFTEDRFFAGTFDLPHDQIGRVFAEGFVSPITGHRETYDRIMVGVAPGGALAVWVGGHGLVREVGFFAAKEAALDWRVVLDNPQVSREQYLAMVKQEEMSKEQLRYLEVNGIPRGLWQRYRTRYDWKPEVLGVYRVSRFWVKLVNGESNSFDASLSSSYPWTLAALPRDLAVTWVARDGNEHSRTVSLDEVEVLSAFQKLLSANPRDPLRLQFEISDQGDDARVFLRNREFVLELQQVSIGE